MAEIKVERQPDRSPWRWVWLVLFVAVIAAAGWYFFLGPGQDMIGRGDAGAAAPGYEVEVEEEGSRSPSAR